jgi:hypothetical protein
MRSVRVEKSIDREEATTPTVVKVHPPRGRSCRLCSFGGAHAIHQVRTRHSARRANARKRFPVWRKRLRKLRTRGARHGGC